MKLREFMKATGATPRQVDYWVRAGIPLANARSVKGSGSYRSYHEHLIPQVQLLVKISNTFGGGFAVEKLKEVFYCYDLGGYELEEGLTLEWEVIDGTNATSERSVGDSGEREDSVRRGGHWQVCDGHGLLYEGGVDP